MTDKQNPEAKPPSETTVNEVSVVETTQESSQPPPVVVQKSGKGLSIFAILLSLLALAGTGFSLYMGQVIEPKKEGLLAVGVAEIGGEISRLGDSIQRLQVAQDGVVSQEVLDAKLSEAENNTDLKVRNTELKVKDVEQAQQQVAALVTKMSDDLNRGTNEYAVAEVAQLLKLANHSVNFSKDANAAINAFKLADAQLKELADPRYATVRQSINEEIGSLETVTVVDVESITGQLRALEKLVPSLALENDIPTLGDVQVSQADGEESIKASLKKLWGDLVALLKPQRIDQAPKPLLAPEQRYFLDQNIQLQLAKAQLSVLQNRDLEYSASLVSAEGLLSGYYDTRDQEVQNVLSKINSLKSTKLSSKLPNVSRSYDLLQRARGGR